MLKLPFCLCPIKLRNFTYSVCNPQGVFYVYFLLQLLATFLHPVLTLVPAGYGVASLCIAFIYQLALSQLGLSQYIQHGPHGDGSRYPHKHKTIFLQLDI